MFLKLVAILVLSSISRAQENGNCPNLATLKDDANKQEVLSALEEVDCIFDDLKNFRNPCDKKKCCDLDDYEECQDPPQEFDYVVVGGGRSGCVIANRLTEVPTNRVVLTDVGKDETSPVTKIPALTAFTKFTKNSRAKCIQQQEDFALAMDHLPYYEGIGFGGSSITNPNVNSNGHPTDFSAPSAGCFDDVITYFQKSEKANLTGQVEAAFHKFDGLLPQTHTSISDLGQAFLSCGLEQGFKEIDPAGNFGQGFSKIRSNSEGGKRINHAEAFLNNILWRKNLVRIGEASVFKILFDKNLRAIGVKYAKNKKIYTLLAKKEIILAKGAINTAHLLMLSGIGPREHLEKHKVQCLKHLPVGQTLFDKVMYVGLAFETNCSSTPSCLDDIINKQNIQTFLESGEGPMAKPYHLEALGNIAINSPTPNVEYRLKNFFWTTDKGEVDMRTIGMSRRFYKKHWQPLEGKRVFTISIILKALSKGRVKLKCNDPFENPEICGKYFSDPQDVKNMVDAIKFILNFMKCDSFKKFGIKFYDKPIPGCEHKKGDKYWECAARHLTVPYRDFSGTCKMGLPDDPTAVVDPDGLVLGCSGLRIVGKSIMPNPAFGGAGAFATMLAEKTCDKIKKQDGIVLPKFCPPK